MRNRNLNQPTGLLRPDAPALPVLAVDPFNLVPDFAPFNLMRRLFDDLNNIGMMPRFDTFDLPQMAKFQKTMWAPQIEVMEKKGEFVLKADLPGLHREDIDVEFTENALVISGERNQETTKEDEGFYQTERNYGSFFRSIPLPDGFDADKAKAVFHNGVLEVSIPMPKKEKKTRKLPVGEKAAKAHAKAA